MKYRAIKLENNKSVLVDESGEIKEGDWFYNPSTKECLLASKRMLSWNNDTSQEHKGWIKIISTINHSISLDVPMVVVEDEVEKLALEHYPITQFEDEFDYRFRLGFKEGFKSAQQKVGYSEDDMFNCLKFYNNYDVRKLGGYKPPTMDNSSTIYNDTIERQIIKEYIQSLNQEYIELETEQVNNKSGSSYTTVTKYKIKTNRVAGQLMAYVKK